jgi:hypothetical protein
MIEKLSEKDRKALIIGTACLVLYISIKFIALPIYSSEDETRQQIENKVFFIKKYYEILNQKAFYEQKRKANESIKNALTKRFLNKKKPALAAASLQKILEGYSKQSSVTIESARIEKPKYISRLLSVPVEISVQSNLKNLTRFLYLIENHEKFMIVEELTIRKSNKKDPEELKSKLLVLGFIKKLEDKKAKKI